jgi:ribosomal protein L7/L12
MRTNRTTFRVWALVQALLSVLLLVLMAKGLVAGLTALGCFSIVYGLSLVSGSLAWPRERWTVVWGVGALLMGLGLISISWLGTSSAILCIVGSVTGLVAMIVLARTRHTVPLPPLPLALAEDIRRKAGLSAQTTEQGPLLQVVLVAIGTKRAKVMRRLRELYSPLGLFEAWSIADHIPAVLQTTTLRREADFVAAQLTELGAQVDIRESPDSEEPGAHEA